MKFNSSKDIEKVNNTNFTHEKESDSIKRLSISSAASKISSQSKRNTVKLDSVRVNK